MWRDPAIKTLAKDYFRQAKDPETTVEKYDDKFKGNLDIQYDMFEEDWEFLTEN